MSLNKSIQKYLISRSKSYILASVAHYSSGRKLREIDDLKLENVKRGTGYRSSFNGITCTVFGTGCIGRAIVNRLGNRGTQVVVPYRSDPYFCSDLRICGDLGQILFTPFHLEDEDSLRRAMKYSDVVINTIGSEINTFRFSLEKTNIDGARRIAKIAREMGVKKLIHFSAMGASPNPREIWIKGGSKFMKSKWFGELAVREEFPDAIIVRPSEVHGELDRFYWYYGDKKYGIFRQVFLWKEGKDTVKMPIYVVDVAHGIYELVIRHIDEVKGETYQFVGPRKYLLHDMVRYFMDLMWKLERFGHTIEDSRFNPLFPIYKTYLDKCYISSPKINLGWERFEREHTNDDLDPDLPVIQSLGVKMHTLEAIAPQFFYIHREEADYSDDLYEMDLPTMPRVLEEIK